MYKANFKNNDDIVIINNIYQYDYNQQLEITGLDLPALIEVHFGIYNEDTTITKLGYTENSITVVDIPNEVLSQTQEVYAYVFLTNESGGRTIKAIRFRPIRRGKPDTYVPMEDSIFLDQVIAKATELQTKNESLNRTIENLIKRNETIEGKFNKIQDTYEKQTAVDSALELVEARTSNRTGKSYEKVGNRLDDIENSFLKRIYGVRRKITNNSSSAWERIESSIGLKAMATKDGNEVENDFDNIYPWSEIISYNYDLQNNKITAYYGEPNFSFDGSNGEVLTKIPEFYWKREIVDDYEYIYISQYHLAGFNKSEEFSIARYMMSVDEEGNAHSFSRTFPEAYRNMTQHRNFAKGMGEEFCLMDYRYFLIMLLYLVEYADYNTQKMLGNGIVSMRRSNNDKALIAENNTNRIIINTPGANYFVVGQYINIGKASCDAREIARERCIIRMELYNQDGISGTAIYFDGDPVNISVGNIIGTSPQKMGQCDILGMKSGCLNNDSKHSIIYRGIEDLYGREWQRLDGINIKDHAVYICKQPAEYISDKFEEPYKELGYVLSDANDVYGKRHGLDRDNAEILLPIEAGGTGTGSSTYLCDGYYSSAGNRVVYVGGAYSYSLYAGGFAVSSNNLSSSSYVTFGCRVLKYQ